MAEEEEKFHSQERNAAVTMDSSDGPSALQAAIRVQEAKLHLTEAEASPILLRAPIDGVIDAAHHSVGETVGPGEPIVTISARIELPSDAMFRGDAGAHARLFRLVN